MKTYYTLPLWAMAFSLSVQAQVGPVNLLNANNEVVNGTTVVLQQELTGALAQTLVQPLDVQNITGIQRTINVRRYELSVVPGTENYFCWGVCYDPMAAGARPLWVSQHPVDLAPGEVSHNFYGDYRPLNNAGSSTFRFVWYDMNSPNDTTWVDINYVATPAAGIEESGLVRGFTAFPNPSMGGDVTLSYELASVPAGTQLVVYNMLGERKLVKAIGAAQGKVVLRNGDLGGGVWFAVLERNGKALATKRLAVVQ